MLFLTKTYFVLGGDLWLGVEGAVKAQVVLELCPFFMSNGYGLLGHLLPRFIAQVLVGSNRLNYIFLRYLIPLFDK